MEDFDCPEGWLGAELDHVSGSRRFCIVNDKSAEVWLLSSSAILLMVNEKGMLKKEGSIKRREAQRLKEVNSHKRT